MIAVCLEHLERAIDEFVAAREQAPDIFMVEQVKEEETGPIPATCAFCAKETRYILSKSPMPA